MSKVTALRLFRKPQFRRLTGVFPDVFREMASRLRPSWEKQKARKRSTGRPHSVGATSSDCRAGLNSRFVELLFTCHN